MATEVQIALQPQAGQDPAAALATAAAKLARSTLATLIQQAGQPVSGKVVAPPANFPAGFTQVAVADHLLTLKLSTPLPVGTSVRVDVRPAQSGQPAVTVQAMPQPAASQPPPAPLPAQTALPLPPALQSAQPLSPAPQSSTLSQPATAASPPIPAAPVSAVPTAAPSPAPQVTAATPAPGPTPVPSTTPSASQPTPAVQSLSTQAPPVQQPSVSGSTQATVQSQASAPTAASAAPPAPATQTSAAPTPTPAPTPAVHGQPATPPVQGAAVPAAQPAVSAVQTPAPSTPAPIAVLPMAPAAAPLPAPASQPSVPNTPAPSAPPQPAPAAPPLPSSPAAPPQAMMQRLTQAFTPPPPAPPTPAPAAGSPAQVAMVVTTQAAAQQQSAAPLMQALAVALPVLPKEVADAAGKVLATRVVLDRGTPTGAGLKQAVLSSGVFVDAPKSAGQADVRQALTQLRGALLSWLGDDVAPVAAVTRRPAPPARGAVPRAQTSDLPQVPSEGAAAREAGKALLSQAEGALSRLKLLQLTSQPADAARPGVAPQAAPAEWNLEVPMLLGRELTMAQIQIQRDGKGKAEARDRHWRLRFALTFSVIGEVGAQVTMTGTRAAVAIWADEPHTAETLEAMLPELGPALSAKGLDLTSLVVRRGAPREEAQPVGRLMDSTR